jgi:phosphoesterase RecJ-like protein
LKVPEEVVSALRGEDAFLIASHIHPEADAIGSQIALASALEAMGKSAVLYNRDGVPELYGFLPGTEKVLTSLPQDTSDLTLILLDCNTSVRAALEGRQFKRSIVIDHHQTESDFGDIKWIAPSAAATGLMVFELLKEMGATITPAMAINLYTAIAVDTGAFRYMNTTPEVLRAAADLAEAGATPGAIAEDLFESWSLPRFKLLCMTLGTLEIYDSVAIVAITEEMFKKTGTSAADTEEFSNFPRMMKDIAVAVFLRELPKGGWKVSLRSKGEHNVARVAVRFEGGGHKNAAGCTVKADLPTAKRNLIEAIREIL